jgi:putative transferase (TIGR04331 family)
MTQLGGEYYRQASCFSKGLTPDLLEQAPLVLWDVPGTGFLECLAGGIPTMVLWPRIYSEEVPWSRPLFEQLEVEGIIFRQVGPLIAELKKFKADPQGWRKQPKRQEALSRFAREYGWAEDNWPTRWRQFLKSLLI